MFEIIQPNEKNMRAACAGGQYSDNIDCRGKPSHHVGAASGMGVRREKQILGRMRFSTETYSGMKL
jgi:hypothetical protein